jgi:FkbM family methyltransferase
VKAAKEECTYVPYRKKTGSFQYCVRGYNDGVSNQIRLTGRWADCDDLPRLWHEVQASRDDIFVDVGGNIGACSALMLHRGISTVAFEPVPQNLFYFTSTAIKNAKNFTGPLTLVMGGVGSAEGKSTIYSQRGNFGHSTVGEALPFPMNENGRRWMRSARKNTLEIVTLDNFFHSEDCQYRHSRIRLLKIDTQGFEGQVFAGAHRLLAEKRIATIAFEMVPSLLRKRNNTCLEISQLLVRHGYRLRLSGRKGRQLEGPAPELTESYFRRLDSTTDGSEYVDVVAILQESTS